MGKRAVFWVSARGMHHLHSAGAWGVIVLSPSPRPTEVQAGLRWLLPDSLFPLSTPVALCELHLPAGSKSPVCSGKDRDRELGEVPVSGNQGMWALACARGCLVAAGWVFSLFPAPSWKLRLLSR